MLNSETKTYWYVGLLEGFPRTWGAGNTPSEAYNQCVASTLNYIIKRPDSGPLSKWQIERE